MTPFPRLYADQPCPIEGYEGYSFRVLLNPTGAEKMDWGMGHLGIQDCPECKAVKKGGYCAACTLARDQLGRAAVAIYGTSHTEGFDFATPAGALASLSQADLPDELLAWLYMLPGALWAARGEELKKNTQQLISYPELLDEYALDDPERRALLDAQRLYADVVWQAYRTRIANECYGSAMSPDEVARTIPIEVLDLLIIWKGQT